VYHADVHPKFPEGGKMTQHLEAMASRAITGHLDFFTTWQPDLMASLTSEVFTVRDPLTANPLVP